MLYYTIKENMNTVINPKSGRKILIGSKTWKQLVNEKIIENNTTIEDNTLYESDKKSNLSVAKDIFSQKNLGNNKRAIISGNKVIKVNNKTTSAELSKHSAKSSAKVFSKIKKGEVEIPEDILNDDEALAEYLEKLIMAELVGGTKPVVLKKKQPPKKTFSKLPPPMTETEFETTEMESSESESE
jgi:hypothetical protein